MRARRRVEGEDEPPPLPPYIVKGSPVNITHAMVSALLTQDECLQSNTLLREKELQLYIDTLWDSSIDDSLVYAPVSTMHSNLYFDYPTDRPIPVSSQAVQSRLYG